LQVTTWLAAKVAKWLRQRTWTKPKEQQLQYKLPLCGKKMLPSLTSLHRVIISARRN